jgi:hypothetical protein
MDKSHRLVNTPCNAQYHSDWRVVAWKGILVYGQTHCIFLTVLPRQGATFIAMGHMEIKDKNIIFYHFFTLPRSLIMNK